MVARTIRVGVMRGGKVVAERILPRGEPLFVGTAEDNHVVIGDAMLPPKHPLIEPLEDLPGYGWRLRLPKGLEARVAGLPRTEGAVDVPTTAASDHAVRTAEGWEVRLNQECKGRIVIGGTRILFQFVVPPITGCKDDEEADGSDQDEARSGVLVPFRRPAGADQAGPASATPAEAGPQPSTGRNSPPAGFPPEVGTANTVSLTGGTAPPAADEKGTAPATTPAEAFRRLAFSLKALGETPLDPAAEAIESRRRLLYRKFQSAQAEVGQDPYGVSYEDFRTRLTDQEHRLVAEHPGKRVEWSVSVEGGKIVFEPVQLVFSPQPLWVTRLDTATEAIESRRFLLYRQFQAAQEQVGQDPHSVSYEDFRERLAANETRLVAKHPGKRVDWSVSVEGGNIMFKPVLS